MNCPAITKDGAPCSMSFGTFGSDGRCYWHTEDPEVVAHRQETRSRGGKATAREKALPPLDVPDNPKNIEEAREYLSWIAHHAITGQLEPRQADAATKAIMTWVRAEDYAGQIRALRKLVDNLKKPTKHT